MLQLAGVQSLVEISSYADPQLASAVKDLYIVLEGVARENAKLLDEERTLDPASKNYAKQRTPLVRAYLDFWANERDRTLRSVDAFVSAARKL